MKAGKLTQKNIAFALSLPILIVIFAPMPATAQSAKAIKLNSEGVVELNNKRYQAAIDKFEEALKMELTFKNARQNLAIAYRSYGIHLKAKPAEAIKRLYKSWMLQPDNKTTLQSMNAMIVAMGKDPNSYADRIQLAKSARAAGNFTGAIVEYLFALKLNDTPEAHEGLGDIYMIVQREEKAALQYNLAFNQTPTTELATKMQKAKSAGAANSNEAAKSKGTAKSNDATKTNEAAKSDEEAKSEEAAKSNEAAKSSEATKPNESAKPAQEQN